MTDLFIQGAFGPVTFIPDGEQPTPRLEDMNRLDAFLSGAGLQLPDAYREFLLATNGGEVTPNGFAYKYDAAGKELLARVLDPQDEILTDSGNTLRYFQGFTPGAITDLISFQHAVQQWGRPGLFGIAAASHGDIVVLDLSPGETFGSVHYLTLQGIAPLVEAGEQVPLAYIAPSFDLFRTVFFDFDEGLAQSQTDRLQDFLARVFNRQ